MKRLFFVLACACGLAGGAFGAEVRDSVHLHGTLREGAVNGLLVDKAFYLVGYDSLLLIPQWVGYHLIKADLKKRVDRKDFPFYPELQAPQGRRALPSDYNGSGFDRGHNAPAADFVRSRPAMRASMSMVNITPQYPDCNRRVWMRLEKAVRDSVKKYGEGWIVTGSFWMSEDSVRLWPGVNAAVRGIGRGVAVPTHFWKVFLLKSKNGQAVYAFLVPNVSKVPGNWKRYKIPVARLEEISGMGFFK